MIASQAARVSHGTRGAPPEGSGIGPVDAFVLTSELLGADGPRAAIRSAVRHLHGALRLPVAAWGSTTVGAPFELVAWGGVSPREASAVRRAVPSVDVTAVAFDALADALGRALGGPRGRVARGTRVAVGVAGVSGPTPPALSATTTLLDGALRRLHEVELARRRNEALDTGLAWTAHEVRRSLAGIRAAVDAAGGGPPSDHAGALLRMAGHELDQLSEDVEGVLRWAIRGRSLRRRPTDVMWLVRTIAAAERSRTVGRVLVRGPAALWVPADQANLRAAIANLVRNALDYASDDRPVAVAVEPSTDRVDVRVRDHGPGIAPEDRESIFDPFVRGLTARGRTGSGLGLFVARRVAEAHGGALWCESNGRGATFVLRLPRAIGGTASSGS
jgi:signal transduction histidine kinase